MNSEPKVYAEHTWGSFVRPAVRLKASDPDTKALIEQMMPYFPLSCEVIAAFLDDADQFWKVNYHWELLSLRVGMAMKLKLTPASISILEGIQKNLNANSPNPDHGYTSSKKVGEPHDRSSLAKITERWTSLRGDKANFRKILDTEKIAENHPPSEGWDLAAAPVARPGTSKHGTGYAVDILGRGKNQLIKTIGSALGATVVFDEKSHVHIEFKQGVLVAKKPVADDRDNGLWSGWRHLV